MKCVKMSLIIAKINFWDIFTDFVFKISPELQE